ncbi:orotidine-5'-phosphate decarboxylase [Paraglaciecola aquimarina]|uniref:Orotidine 5'-phosphate decarboxylase n=1 Tax=Paraglaciecola algarum TaxID=3050085 RepID=A0ABS9D4T8_9ALTE|nr:orotidine-5'-phosphate decarboxylase [Paraglaciecola sp. G1-23]MCF2947032.1 orotidine-5'-phosphate decarboxylase [Paraglaciecola sp. G1-23]
MDPKVLVALDFAQQDKANQFIQRLDPSLCRLKVGKEMFTHFGPSFVKGLIDKNFDVFLDLKFHDIPNTVAKACLAAADLGVWMVNVHASGGPKMMEQAQLALQSNGTNKPLLIAVTVLTSMDQQQLSAIGINSTPEEHVLRLAKLTHASGLDGVVCSAQEASLLKSKVAADFTLVTPGIRPEGSDKGDQMRIMTPKQAIDAGSDYLVIGRPITQSSNPIQTLIDINQSIL